MQIKRVELWHVEVPLDPPFHPSWIPGYPQTANHFTLLRLTTGDGETGVAAGAAFGREREGLGEILGPYLMDLDATDVATARQRIRELSFLGWHNWWIEMAFWDLKGKAHGAPLWKLLRDEDDGDAPRTLRAYCSSGERRSPEEAASFVEDRVAEGFGAVKLRVHAPTLEEDVAVVEAAREAAPDLTLMVDANQGWRVDLLGGAPLWDLDRARRFCEAMGPLEVAWVEEPLDMHAFDDLAALREASPVPVAGGELVQGWPVLERYLREGCLDVLQPDCVFAGGVTTARRTLEAALDRGLAFSPHTWTNGLGLVANLHVLASHPDPGWLEFPHDPPAWTAATRDGVLAAPVRAEKGDVPVPRAPGLGPRVDDDLLERYGELTYEATPLGVARDVVKQKGWRAAFDIFRRKRG